MNAAMAEAAARAEQLRADLLALLTERPDGLTGPSAAEDLHEPLRTVLRAMARLEADGLARRADGSWFALTAGGTRSAPQGAPAATGNGEVDDGGEALRALLASRGPAAPGIEERARAFLSAHGLAATSQNMTAAALEALQAVAKEAVAAREREKEKAGDILEGALIEAESLIAAAHAKAERLQAEAAQRAATARAKAREVVARARAAAILGAVHEEAAGAAAEQRAVLDARAAQLAEREEAANEQRRALALITSRLQGLAGDEATALVNEVVRALTDGGMPAGLARVIALQRQPRAPRRSPTATHLE